MIGVVDWAAGRARMVIAFILLSLTAGALAYASLPKEGEPDIEIPAIFISVPFPGISAEDSEKLLVKPMETELADLDGLQSLQGTAAEGYAGVALEFEFGWDKTQVMADVRDKMNNAEAAFPSGAEQYSIAEINFSEFPIIIVNLTGALPERTLLRVAKDMQDRLESLEPVLEAALTGHRDEMVEVVIDPLRLEAYNVTAGELINIVVNNNQLIAAGEIETASGSFAVKIPSSFDEQQDIFELPVKVAGDRVVTLGDLADIRLTFEDRAGTARFNGETTVALQVVKRKGFNILDMAGLVKAEVEAEQNSWPPELQQAISVGTSNDQSRIIGSMVSQLEGSVLTAIALVMIVVLATLGVRSALLVGFAIPTSFLLCFALLAVMGIPISNIVMFGLILAVGMLVDGAIVVVEYADKRISEGTGPMAAYTEAAKRMFWPIVSSTATTLCAFLPMLFWPGVPGQFMGMLPITLIFVLSASLVVALIYLPVMGGAYGRFARMLGKSVEAIARSSVVTHIAIIVGSAAFAIAGVNGVSALQPALGSVAGGIDVGNIAGSLIPKSALVFAIIVGLVVSAIAAIGGFVGAFLAILAIFQRVGNAGRWLASKIRPSHEEPVASGYRRSRFGRFIEAIAGNPIMPIISIGTIFVLVMSTFLYFGANNNGVEFFVESEPEQAIVYVRARGNLSLDEKDALVREVEDVILDTQGIDSAFAFAGSGGLNANTGGAAGPVDTIGQVQIELIPWEDRPAFAAKNDFDLEKLDGDIVIETLQGRLDQIPGIKVEILNLARGPASGKPVHLRLRGDNWEELLAAVDIARAKFEATDGLIDIEDNLPLPGIDWQINVDVEKAGRYGADVATVGGMVQLVTRGILLDTMRVDSSDEEIEIRVRLPEKDRVLSTLDTLKVRTQDGLVPLSNFITREPVAQLAQINRIGQKRFFDVKADVAPGLKNEDGTSITANERIAVLTEWLESERPISAGLDWEWTGDQEEQEESQAFLQVGFSAALGLMFIILLAQFNSFYNAALVLMAVVLSTTGVLIGMLVMGQPFSIIMTGTGIVALAGIVVNNNIVLIDTYQEYSQYMPKVEAIVRTAEARIRPVLLTTITTMAGLAPMMFGLSLDFIGGGFSIDSPTALWWKQLATAVVFGLGIATVLTLVFTPSMLALRIWFWTGAYRSYASLRALSHGTASKTARDLALGKSANKVKNPEIIWDVDDEPSAPSKADKPELRAAE